jgi:acyl carrier protein
VIAQAPAAPVTPAVAKARALSGPELEQKIVALIAQLSTVRQSEIKLDDRLREDLGLDSVGSMELLSMLAEEFDLDVSLEEAMAATTVRGAIEMAKTHLEQRA